MNNFFSNDFSESFSDFLKNTTKIQESFYESVSANLDDTLKKNAEILASINTNSSQKQTNHDDFNSKINSFNDYINFISPTLTSFNTSITKWMVSLSQQGDLLDSQKSLLEDLAKLNLYLINRLEGNEVDPVIHPQKKDFRFSHQEWNENPYFDVIKQFYLLFSNWLHSTIELNPNLDAKTKATVSFYIRQLTEALSPSNYLFSNPELIQKTLDDKGKNLCEGIQTFIDQLQSSSIGNFSVNPINKNAYTPGENLATTPGSVIFKNDIIELIYYTPQTATVHEIPILIIPPFINKYYIMDLCPKKSMVEWLVQSGISVFMISW